jgi:hypothetical protein
MSMTNEYQYHVIAAMSSDEVHLEHRPDAVDGVERLEPVHGSEH